MNVDVIVEDDRWGVLGLETLAARAAASLCEHLSLPPDLSLAVMGCDDARIASLNTEFRGKDAPTNVLSWPSDERGSGVIGVAPPPPEAGEELGDIAMSYDTMLREAEDSGIPLENHVTHLIVHGILHLLGYDHEDEADGDLMESVETAILARLGIADPYS